MSRSNDRSHPEYRYGERMPENQQHQKALKPPNQQQQDAVKKLGGLFNKERPYTPLAKSLEAAHIKPRVMDIMLGEEPVECLVIPVQELIYKEWKHMTGGFDSNDVVVSEVKDGAGNVVAIHEEREEDGN
jgi:hypothetical protein